MPSGVEQHDENEQGERHVIAHDQEGSARDGCCAKNVGDAHERAAGEPVRECSGGQREEKPGRLSAATTLDTASGWGLTMTARSGTAP